MIRDCLAGLMEEGNMRKALKFVGRYAPLAASLYIGGGFIYDFATASPEIVSQVSLVVEHFGIGQLFKSEAFRELVYQFLSALALSLGGARKVYSLYTKR